MFASPANEMETNWFSIAETRNFVTIYMFRRLWRFQSLWKDFRN